MTLKTPRTVPHPVLTAYYSGEDERQRFVVELFDASAKDYDRIGALMALGSGPFYRRWTLRRAGLRPGMKALDVAAGTGQVTRAAAQILGDARAVVGVDPNGSMLREARKVVSAPLVSGTAEALPFAPAQFDFVSMGFALRHVADLEAAFAEYFRVLKPAGRLLVLEVTRPRSALGQRAMRFYLYTLLPLVIRITTRNAQAALLMKYYWDTIAECVPRDTILDVLRASGFVQVQCRVSGGIFTEYVAVKSAAL